MTGPPRSLAGKRIVVTRARSQASSLVAALSELGAEVIELPMIEIVPLESYDELDAALRSIARYQWLIVTSANTVRVLAGRMAGLGLGSAIFAGLRKVAIGSATARAMQERGVAVDVVPERYVAESLVEALGDRVEGSRILLARASVARDVIPNELARRGATVDVIDAYRTIAPSGAAEEMRNVFSDPKRLPDAVTFTGSSMVKSFIALWKEAGLEKKPQRLRAISIGPITSATLEEMNWMSSVEAERHDVQGLIEAVTHAFQAETLTLQGLEREDYTKRAQDHAQAELPEAED